MIVDADHGDGICRPGSSGNIWRQPGPTEGFGLDSSKAQPGSMRRFLPAIVISFVFALGAMFGVLVQAYYGVGNVLRTMRAIYSGAPVALQPTAIPVLGIPEEFQGKLALFILAGQSNMSGRAELPVNQTADSRICRLVEGEFGPARHVRLTRQDKQCELALEFLGNTQNRDGCRL